MLPTPICVLPVFLNVQACPNLYPPSRFNKSRNLKAYKFDCSRKFQKLLILTLNNVNNGSFHTQRVYLFFTPTHRLLWGAKGSFICHRQRCLLRIGKKLIPLSVMLNSLLSFLYLNFPTALCVLFIKLPHICYISRSLMPLDFYKLQSLRYAIHPRPPPPPPVTSCIVWPHHLMHKLLRNIYHNATNKHTSCKQITT
jgi:hypothetical protein